MKSPKAYKRKEGFKPTDTQLELIKRAYLIKSSLNKTNQILTKVNASFAKGTKLRRDSWLQQKNQLRSLDTMSDKARGKRRFQSRGPLLRR